MGLLGRANQADAQSVPHTSPLNADFYHSRYLNTLSESRLQNWPLTTPLGSGRYAFLHHLDALGQPVYYTAHSNPLAAGTRTRALYEGGSLGLKLDGSSPAVAGKLGMWDGGQVRSNHRELAGKITQTDNPKFSADSDHATHMAGILVGRGLNQSAQGMAFGSRLQAWDLEDDLSEIIRQAPNLLVSNHAYGPVAGWVLDPTRPGDDNDAKWEWWGTPSVSITEDYRFGFYDEAVGEIDRIAFNFPYFLMVRSADNKRAETGPLSGTKYYLRNTDEQSTVARSPNNGYDVIPGEANAKNVLTVGAADLGAGGFGLSRYSGWGPTDDGRIKPDLLGIGTSVVSSVGGSDDAYGVLTGTSMASANVSGSLILLQELYHQNFGSFMLSSTLKGLALHTADKPNGEASPDYTYGWGLLNVERAATVMLNKEGSYLLEQKVHTQGEPFTRDFVASGDAPLVVTICWTDPEGIPAAASNLNVNNRTPRLVNDLDIRLQEGFNVHYPWVLNPAFPAQKAERGDNFRDNIEQIHIANPVPGRTYTLTVSNKNLLKSSRQPYALLASGLATPDCGQAAILTPGTDTTLCIGSTIILAANAGSGFTYEWLRNGTSIQKGSARTLDVVQSGSYAVRVSTAGCSKTSNRVVVRNSNVFASLSQQGDIQVCDSKGLELSANTGAGFAYQWLRDGVAVANATTPKYRATVSGRYQVRISQNNCVAISEAAKLSVSPVQATLDPAVSAVICNATPVLLKVPQQKECTYAWYHNATLVPGAASASYQATKPGRYAVEVSQGGCSLRSPDVVLQQSRVEATIKTPATTEIKVGGSVALQAIHALGNRYEWRLNDSLLVRETAPLLIARAGGRYRVSVTNNACTAQSPEVLLWGGITVPGTPSLVTGIFAPQDSTAAFLVYPSPAREVLTVALRQPSGTPTEAYVALYDISGRRLAQKPLRREGTYLRARLDVGHLPAGTYLVEIRLGNRTVVRRFLKE